MRSTRARVRPAADGVRADIVPGSVQTQPDGTLLLRAVLASGYAVRTLAWTEQGIEEIEEVFSFEPGAHRNERLDSGRVCLVPDHQTRDAFLILGKVFDPTWDRTAQTVTVSVRVSARAELAGLRGDLQAGIVSSFSAGYRVYAYRDVTEKGAQLRRLLAIDWEIREASLVAVPADPNASTRASDEPDSERGEECEVWENPEPNRSAMTTVLPVALTPAAQPSPVTPTPTPAPEAERAAPVQPAAAPIVPAAAQPAAPVNGGALERQRVASIRGKLTRAGLPLEGDFARTLLDQEVSAADAGDRILGHLTRDQGDVITSQVTTIDSDADKSIRALEDALTARIMTGQLTRDEQTKLGERLQGSPYASRTLLEMGEDYLGRVLGQRAVAHGSKLDRAATILHTRRHDGQRSSPGFHVTGDFPSVLANVAHKSMRRQFDLTRETYSAWTVRGILTDFKQALRAQLSEAARLIRVPEGAEYRYGAIGDTGEPIQLLKYGRILPLSMEAMVNDDLGAFARLPRSFGGMSQQLVADLVYAHLTGNTVMSDGLGIFHSTHANLVTGAGNSFAAAGVDALSNVRVLGRNQKAVPSGDPIETAPFIAVDLPHLRVPTALETAAQRLTSTIQPALVGSVNPFSGAFQTVMAEPRLDVASAIAFYMFADPGQMDTIEVSYLQGEDGPVVESRIGFTTDGVEIKVRLVVATSPIEFRGMYKNNGTT